MSANLHTNCSRMMMRMPMAMSMPGPGSCLFVGREDR